MGNAVAGSDTLSINGTLIPDLVDGDTIDLKYDTDIMAVSRGKNGNTTFAQNQKGFVSSMAVRVLRGSPSDIYLNSLLAAQLNSPSTFPLMYGSYVKKIADGKGNVLNDESVLGGGVFKIPVDAKTNEEGDTNAEVAVYNIKWSRSQRSIG
jgi:hypothetical protein